VANRLSAGLTLASLPLIAAIPAFRRTAGLTVQWETLAAFWGQVANRRVVLMRLTDRKCLHNRSARDSSKAGLMFRTRVF
jgi:hypothetical protein